MKRAIAREEQEQNPGDGRTEADDGSVRINAGKLLRRPSHPGRPHATADRRSVRSDHIGAVDSAGYITAH